MYYRLPLIIGLDPWKTYYSCKLLLQDGENKSTPSQDLDKDKQKEDTMLSDQEVISSDKNKPTFVIPVDTRASFVRLFTIDAPFRLENMTFSEGFVDDVNVLRRQIRLSTNSNDHNSKLNFNCLEIQISPASTSIMGAEAFIGTYRETDRGQKYIVKGKVKEVLGQKIEVKINFTTYPGEDAYEGSFYAVFINEDSFYHLALDFGSEASQAAYSRVDGKVNMINLIDAIAKYHYELKEDEASQTSDFEQYSADSEPHLLRSKFYIHPKKIQSQLITRLKNKEALHIKLLTIEKEGVSTRNSIVSNDENKVKNLKDWVKIPNLKLLEISKEATQELIFQDSDNISTIRDNLLKTLVYCCLCEIGKRANDHRQKKIAIKLTLLMPNIFSQITINQIIEEINNFVNECGISEIIGVQIGTISESDASFLGAIQLPKFKIRQPNKALSRYLVIDAGSGTIDISVIEHKTLPNEQFTCLFRTGLAGAGRFLNFAFAKAYLLANRYPDLTTLLKGNLTNEELISSSFGYGQAKKNYSREIEEILDLAEEFKIKNACELNVPVLENETIQTSVYQKVKLIEIKSIMENSVGTKNSPPRKFEDNYGVVRGAIDSIVNQIISLLDFGDIATTKFDKVIFAGRAIAYDPLRQEIIGKLRNNEMLSAASNYDSIFYDFHSSKRMCLDGALCYNDSINLRTQTIGTLSIRRDAEANGASNPLNQHFFHPNEDFFLGATEDNYFLAQPGDCFFIGNYEQHSPSLKITDENLFRKIAFTHEGYYIRFESGQKEELLSDALNQNLTAPHMVQWSLFPYVTYVSEGDISHEIPSNHEKNGTIPSNKFDPFDPNFVPKTKFDPFAIKDEEGKAAASSDFDI